MKLVVKDKRTKEKMELDAEKVLDNIDYFMLRYGLVKYRAFDFVHSN